MLLLLNLHLDGELATPVIFRPHIDDGELRVLPVLEVERVEQGEFLDAPFVLEAECRLDQSREKRLVPLLPEHSAEDDVVAQRIDSTCHEGLLRMRSGKRSDSLANGLSLETPPWGKNSWKKVSAVEKLTRVSQGTMGSRNNGVRSKAPMKAGME